MHTFGLKRVIAAAVFSLLITELPSAQVVGPVPSPFNSIEQNSTSNIAAFGDTLWVGPGLNRNIGNASDWYLPQGADSVVNGRGRVFSLSLGRDTVLAGLGYDQDTPEGSVQTGMGYYLSDDGGDSWSFVPLPLEEESDTEIIYGGVTYTILPIMVPQQSPPFKVDFEGQTIFSANWASGILRSRDFGKTWQRIMLPPVSEDSLVPGNSYTFDSNEGNRYDPRFDQNLLGFSVLVDRDNAIWAGTAGGVNISDNAMTAPRDSIRWRHLRSGGLLGNWVIAIREQPSTGDIWMSNWISGLDTGEQFGIVRTSDGGNTFDRYLVGERINDIGFSGEYVFAAGDAGLYISPDNGKSWEYHDRIDSPTTFIKSTARHFSVASTNNRVWIGTSDGLASTADLGRTWEIRRVNFPLSGRNRYREDAPEVDAYAYPNPYSPSRHEIVRIKFRVESGGSVKIRLFDFGMNLIRKLENSSFPSGTYEAVWDGQNSNGKKVANGPVFYQIDTPARVIRGKILVLD